MKEDYTFEKFWKDLADGFQIYYKYLGNKYLISKLEKNCYSQELIECNEKNAQPKFLILTLRRVKEIFPYMEDIEYKI